MRGLGSPDPCGLRLRYRLEMLALDTAKKFKAKHNQKEVK
jgi:hypothetical protein